MGVTREIPWSSLKEGFPPHYTEWIGKQALSHLTYNTLLAEALERISRPLP